MFGQAIAQQFVGGTLNWQTGSVLAIFLLAVVLVLTFATSRFLRQGRRHVRPHRERLLPATRRDVSHVEQREARTPPSSSLFLIFLYAPTVVLLVFSFNGSTVAALPFVGFTTNWYQIAWNEPGIRHALIASLKVAVGARRPRDGARPARLLRARTAQLPLQGGDLGLVLVPLVVPTVALGIALLVLFAERPGVPIPLGLWAVLIGHIVIALPFCVLILLPRIASIDRHLEEAAQDLGASWFATFRRVILPLITPALISAMLIAFVVSIDEVVIASFLVQDQLTYPSTFSRAFGSPSESCT